MTPLVYELSRYAAALARGLASTSDAEERTVYRDHLASAARWLGMLGEGVRLAELLREVEVERRRFGWQYLSDDAGATAIRAFEAFATRVAGETSPPDGAPPNTAAPDTAAPDTAIRIGTAQRSSVEIRVPDRRPGPRPTVEDWLHCRIEVAAGAFTASYAAYLETEDLVGFHSGLVRLYETLEGEAALQPAEGQIELRLIGDGRGHARAVGRAADALGNTLVFEIELDQTELPAVVKQLSGVLARLSTGP